MNKMNLTREDLLKFTDADWKYIRHETSTYGESNSNFISVFCFKNTHFVKFESTINAKSHDVTSKLDTKTINKDLIIEGNKLSNKLRNLHSNNHPDRLRMATSSTNRIFHSLAFDTIFLEHNPKQINEKGFISELQNKINDFYKKQQPPFPKPTYFYVVW